MIIASTPIFVAIIGWSCFDKPCGVFQTFIITVTLIGVLIVMQPPGIVSLLGFHVVHTMKINNILTKMILLKKLLL